MILVSKKNLIQFDNCFKSDLFFTRMTYRRMLFKHILCLYYFTKNFQPKIDKCKQNFTKREAKEQKSSFFWNINIKEFIYITLKILEIKQKAD